MSGIREILNFTVVHVCLNRVMYLYLRRVCSGAREEILQKPMNRKQTRLIEKFNKTKFFRYLSYVSPFHKRNTY